MRGLRGLGCELVRAPGELDITIGDAARGVCPPAKRHLAVVDADIGMVILRFGELTHAVHERERLGEVSELERPLERSVDLVPVLRLRHAAIMPTGEDP